MSMLTCFFNSHKRKLTNTLGAGVIRLVSSGAGQEANTAERSVGVNTSLIASTWLLQTLVNVWT